MRARHFHQYNARYNIDNRRVQLGPILTVARTVAWLVATRIFA